MNRSNTGSSDSDVLRRSKSFGTGKENDYFSVPEDLGQNGRDDWANAPEGQTSDALHVPTEPFIRKTGRRARARQTAPEDWTPDAPEYQTEEIPPRRELPIRAFLRQMMAADPQADEKKTSWVAFAVLIGACILLAAGIIFLISQINKDRNDDATEAAASSFERIRPPQSALSEREEQPEMLLLPNARPGFLCYEQL